MVMFSGQLKGVSYSIWNAILLPHRVRIIVVPMPRPQVHAPPARRLLRALVLLIVIPDEPFGGSGGTFLGALRASPGVVIVSLLGMGRLSFPVPGEEPLGPQ